MQGYQGKKITGLLAEIDHQIDLDAILGAFVLQTIYGVECFNT